MTKTEPRSMREAIAAELLGELDNLVNRVEQMQAGASLTQRQLQSTTDALTETAEKFRAAVSQYVDDARNELIDHIERRSASIVTRTVEEQRAAIQEIARLAVRQAYMETAAERPVRGDASAKFRALAMVAFVAGVTGAVVGAFLRH
jgi:phage-related tail protein